MRATRRTPVKYAYARATGDGRLLTVVTARPVAFVGCAAPNAAPKAGFRRRTVGANFGKFHALTLVREIGHGSEIRAVTGYRPHIPARMWILLLDRVHELRPLRVVKDRFEQMIALFLGHFDNADRHQPIDIDGFPAGFIVRPENGMHRLAIGRDTAIVTSLGRAVVVVVDRIAPRQLRPIAGSKLS